MSVTRNTEPFEAGRSYRVKKSFSAMRDDFREGEVLKYKKRTYSRYDGVAGHFFIDGKDSIKSWDVRDEDSVEVWSELFEAL